MQIHYHQLAQLVIKPMLQFIGQEDEVTELLVATAVQESGLADSANRQGLGLYRITEAKHLELWDTYLIRDPELASRLRGLASQHAFLQAPHQELISNLSYSSAMALMIYRAAGAPMHCGNSPEQLARLWSDYFDNGCGQPRHTEEFIANGQQQALLPAQSLAA